MSFTCWAAGLGGCDGALTREHVVSRTILSPTVKIQGFFLEHDRLLTLGRDSFVSKCLCDSHNNALSPCDSEARRFKDAVEWLAADRVAGDTPAMKSIDGPLLAKWCAKTACNIAVVSRKHPPFPFVQYAFSLSDHREIFFYFLPQVGDTLEFGRHAQEFHWLRHADNVDAAAIVLYLFGLPFMLSTFEVRGSEPQVCEKLEITTSDPKGAFVDRLGEINAGALGSIHFQWPGFA